MRTALLTTVAMLACAGAAMAETPPSAKSGALLKKAPPAATVGALTQAPLEQPVSAARGIQITTEQGDTSVAFRYGWSTASGKGFGTDASTAVFQTYAFTASAPLADSGDSQLASLDALASGFALEAKYTHTTITRAKGRNGDAMTAMCARLTAAKPEILTERPDFIDKCSLELFGLYGAEDEFEAFKTLVWGERPTATIWGASARVGKDSFDFFDPTTLAEGSADKTAWSVKGFWAHRPLDGDWLLTLAAEHQDAYEASDAAILCPTATGVVTCVNGPIGAPQKVRKDIVSAEYRRAFKGFSAATVLQYDVNNDVSAVEVPIYLVRDKDGDLNGGVKLGWRSDTGDVTAGVFIGTAFGLGASY